MIAGPASTTAARGIRLPMMMNVLVSIIIPIGVHAHHL